jgi:hypothetical protein
MNTKEWLDDVVQSALCSRVTIQATYDAACAVIRNGVPGDFVECGVWAGANSAAMAKAIQDQYCIRGAGSWYKGKRVHLFDSFEGIPAAGPHDKGWKHEAGTSACSIDVTKQQMKAWGIPEEMLLYHEGWFAETLPLIEGGGITGAWHRGRMPKQIALLRLDGDLYESTKVCLEHLYPLVSPGGIVIVDDWALPGCRKAVQEYGLPAGPIYFHKEP